MAVVVTGNGRCGTNVCLEILAGSSVLEQTSMPEDKMFFTRGSEYPQNYLTKTDTHYFSHEDFINTLSLNPNLNVIWMIRDPRDMCMSKLRRGATSFDGGDSGSIIADDGTPEGCLEDMNKMFDIYFKVHEFMNIKLVKMEDILLDIESTTKSMCEFLQIPYEENMIHFYNRMRNHKKVERYGRKIDKTQIHLWKNWETAYDGWLKKKFDMEDLFEKVSHMTEFFGYE